MAGDAEQRSGAELPLLAHLLHVIRSPALLLHLSPHCHVGAVHVEEGSYKVE